MNEWSRIGVPSQCLFLLFNLVHSAVVQEEDWTEKLKASCLLEMLEEHNADDLPVFALVIKLGIFNLGVCINRWLEQGE